MIDVMTVYLDAVAAQVILYLAIIKIFRIQRTQYMYAFQRIGLSWIAGLAWLMLPWIDAIVATVVAVGIAIWIDPLQPWNRDRD